MFKLSFSSNAFINYSLVEAINYISFMGFDAVEILGDIPHIITPSHQFNDQNLKSEINNIKHNLQKTNLVVSNINTNDCKEFLTVCDEEPFFTCAENVFKFKLKQIKRNVEIAKTLNCLNISISSGIIQEGKTRNEVLDIFFKNLNTTLSLLPENINLCIELEPGHLIENLNGYKEIFKNFNNKNLGINLDIGHLYCAGEKIEDAFEKFSDKIFHIHFEDIEDRNHYHLIPGYGNLPLKNILGFLRKNYSGFVCVELYTYKDNPVKACYESKLYFNLLKYGKDNT